jgi:hypothetical protein
MRYGRTAVALILTLLLVPATALAQYTSQAPKEDPEFCVTAYYNFNSGGGLYKDLSSATLEKSISHGMGLSFMALASRLVSAELDFNYVFSPFGSSSSDVLGSNRIVTTTIDGLVGPSVKAGAGSIRPYVLAGGGYMRGSVGKRHYFGWSDNGKNLALLEAGGGVLWRFNDHVGVRADVRYRWGFGSREDDDTYGDYFKDWTYARSTVGLTISF